MAFLFAMDLLEDFTTKNTAKDNKYLIKCCEFCKYPWYRSIYILVLLVIRFEGVFGMEGGSVSRVKVILEISSKGIAEGEIVRHSSPLTSAAILKSLPMQRRANKFENRFVYMETHLGLGREKQRTRFERGEMAFMTLNGSICVFLTDTVSAPMNPLGLVESNLDLLEAVEPGDLLIIRRATDKLDKQIYSAT
jgi:hypothetical protein